MEIILTSRGKQQQEVFEPNKDSNLLMKKKKKRRLLDCLILC